jgi:hypothetical protein
MLNFTFSSRGEMEVTILASYVEFFAFENHLDSFCRNDKVASERAMLIPLFAASSSRDSSNQDMGFSTGVGMCESILLGVGNAG